MRGGKRLCCLQDYRVPSQVLVKSKCSLKLFGSIFVGIDAPNKYRQISSALPQFGLLPPEPHRHRPRLSMSKSTLSSVVSNLVRASMGASVSNAVPDDDLDRHVAELILNEAKQKAERYGSEGYKAYLPQNGWCAVI